jgi:hypothetical protein
MKKPILGLIILAISISLLSQPGRVLTELINPSMIDTDGERLFILDGVTVYAYSLKDFQLLNKFGKRGEGPGELMTQPDLPLNMIVHNGQVMLNSFRKLAYFDKDGHYIKEKKIPYLVSQIIPIGDKLAVSKFNRRSDGSSTLSVILTDESFNLLKTVYSNELLNDQGRGKIAWPLLNIFIQVWKDRLLVFDQQLGFQINIYDKEGNKSTEIKKPYERIEITETYRQKTLEWLKLQPAIRNAPEEIKSMIYFLKHLPVFNHCLVRDDNIYIQTSRIKKEKAEFFVLDFSGQVLKQAYLTNAKPESIRLSPASHYTFYHNRYYYLRENEDEEWEIHIQKFQ